MFGHQDDQTEPQDNQDDKAVTDENQTASTDEPATNGVDELVIEPGPEDSDNTPADNPPATDDSWQHPGSPLDDDKKPIKDIISPAGGSPKQLSYQHQDAPKANDSDAKTDDDDPANKELIGIRDNALNDLSPIVNKLDLPPEDKFRVLMMVIQSNDNQDLVKQAYDAAHAIEDEKARAQALFDIVNEINYFTSPHENQPDTD